MTTLYPSVLQSVEGRRCVLTAALNITRNTSLTPQEYELQLLHQFVNGDLTIEQVVQLLEAQEESNESFLLGV